MAVDRPTMNQIISNVFDEMLGMPTQPDSSPADLSRHTRVVASIRISGAAEELVVVEAPADTASLIAETMFAAEPGTLEDDEIRDAVGEVVNMIGGNVKGVYNGESQLSLPCVSEECSPIENYHGEAEVEAVTVSGLPLVIKWQDMCTATV